MMKQRECFLKASKRAHSLRGSAPSAIFNFRPKTKDLGSDLGPGPHRVFLPTPRRKISFSLSVGYGDHELFVSKGTLFFEMPSIFLFNKLFFYTTVLVNG